MRRKFSTLVVPLLFVLLFVLLAVLPSRNYVMNNSSDSDVRPATSSDSDVRPPTSSASDVRPAPLDSVGFDSGSAVDLLRFFGYNNNNNDSSSASSPANAGRITWAHAVNSKRLFREAVAAGIDFLEADILIRGGGGGGGGGARLSSSSGVPIMAHPPAVDSDLTLAEFLEMSSPLRAGIKLDFKTVEALRGSVDVLTAHVELRRRQQQRRRKTKAGEEEEEEANAGSHDERPLWMNADIVGHGRVTEGKVDADEFLNVVTRVTPTATLSVGWNIDAGYFMTGSDESDVATMTTNSYGDDDVRRMRDALTRNGVSATRSSLTFAVWSKFIAGSKETLRWLTTDQFPRSSVTVWGREGDASAAEVKLIYDVLTRDRVFLDLPDGLRGELNL